LTFCILENFPDKLQKRLIDIWKEKEWKRVIDASPSMKHYHLPTKHEIFQEFPDACTVEYYENTPHSNASPHLDRGRWCAINVPIVVDTDKSCFLTGKYFQLTKYRRKEDRINYAFTTEERGPKGFFHEDEELYDYYNLEKPVIFCTKVPHGYHNNADTNRVLCSITFDKKWEEVLHLIPQEWY